MFNKFDHIWQKLEVKDKNMVLTEEKLKKMGWMIYILAKQNIFESNAIQSLPEYAFLILATLHLIVMRANQDEVEIGILKQATSEKEEFVLKYLEATILSQQNQQNVVREPIMKIQAQLLQYLKNVSNVLVFIIFLCRLILFPNQKL